MEKINFVNNSTPALNSTNLNKLQDNIEDSIKSQKTLSDTDTYSCNYINEIKDGEVYSTTETKTNKKWINGKPIYRKVINKTTAISANNWTPFYYSTDLGISNIDFIRVIDAILTKTGNIKESVWSSPARLQYLNGYLSIFVDSDVFGEQFIVEYTKTTD